MRLFNRRSKSPPSMLAYWFGEAGSVPVGYHRLVDAPEVSACINRMSAIIASATIQLVENTDKGDRRIRDGLSRLVDIDPWPGVATRSVWMDWIVSTMLGEGDGNAYVLPEIEYGKFSALTPMPGACAIPTDNPNEYRVSWRGGTYHPSEVLHFRLFSDPVCPWRGRGYRVQAQRVVDALDKTDAIKQALSNPDYKPPLCVFVNSGIDFSVAKNREAFREEYLTDSGDGKPWILPADLVKIEQVKPLTLSDLAVKDTIELDKRTVASLYGVPPFLLGLGSYNASEYNSFIRTVILPIAVGIEQELTAKLLESDKRYFRFNRRRLYDYDLKTLIDIDNSMADRGYLNGDEVREDADRDPAGLTEFKILENYIPYYMSANQKKLTEEGDNAG